jgi:predicted nucleic acid-binding protein
MVFKVLIDANVLLDLVLQRDRYLSAKELHKRIEAGEVRAFMSPSIVHIVAYWAKQSHSADKVKEILIDLCAFIEVLSVGHEITTQALQSEMKDIEDSLQYYAAMAYRLDTFISNDKQLKKEAIPDLPVVAPHEFLKTLQTHN